ncbi:MAG TPA: triose-phosphate isomerase [Bacteroidales bacterium]|nr:triose-phosphate isomerase [Bacteroidales bacterium]
MRQKIVAGNWKMNKNLQEGIELAKEIDKLVSGLTNSDVKVILAPSFVNITEVRKAVSPKISVSAQNCAAEASGAYTGEVSASMIKSTGAEYTIIGHSERRAYYGETDAILLKKVKLALANGLKPIFCIGEVLEERESGKHFDVVKKQIENGLFELTADEFKNVVLAYEPVWAIGTGKTATSAQAQEIHKFIRETVASKYGKAVADNTSILYGGSCKASNAKELFANPDVDGGLIGGAALVATEFLGIITGF